MVLKRIGVAICHFECEQGTALTCPKALGFCGGRRPQQARWWRTPQLEALILRFSEHSARCSESASSLAWRRTPSAVALQQGIMIGGEGGAEEKGHEDE